MNLSTGTIGRYGILVRALVGTLIFARLIVMDAQSHGLPFSSIFFLLLSTAGFALCVYQIYLGIAVIRNFADVHITPTCLEAIDSDGVKQYQWTEVQSLQQVPMINFPLYKASIPNRKGVLYFSTRKKYWLIGFSSYDFSKAGAILRQNMELLKHKAAM